MEDSNCSNKSTARSTESNYPSHGKKNKCDVKSTT